MKHDPWRKDGHCCRLQASALFYSKCGFFYSMFTPLAFFVDALPVGDAASVSLSSVRWSKHMKSHDGVHAAFGGGPPLCHLGCR